MYEDFVSTIVQSCFFSRFLYTSPVGSFLVWLSDSSSKNVNERMDKAAPSTSTCLIEVFHYVPFIVRVQSSPYMSLQSFWLQLTTVSVVWLWKRIALRAYLSKYFANVILTKNSFESRIGCKYIISSACGSGERKISILRMSIRNCMIFECTCGHDSFIIPVKQETQSWCFAEYVFMFVVAIVFVSYL